MGAGGWALSVEGCSCPTARHPGVPDTHPRSCRGMSQVRLPPRPHRMSCGFCPGKPVAGLPPSPRTRWPEASTQHT